MATPVIVLIGLAVLVLVIAVVLVLANAVASRRRASSSRRRTLSSNGSPDATMTDLIGLSYLSGFSGGCDAGASSGGGPTGC